MTGQMRSVGGLEELGLLLGEAKKRSKVAGGIVRAGGVK